MSFIERFRRYRGYPYDIFPGIFGKVSSVAELCMSLYDVRYLEQTDDLSYPRKPYMPLSDDEAKDEFLAGEFSRECEEMFRLIPYSDIRAKKLSSYAAIILENLRDLSPKLNGFEISSNNVRISTRPGVGASVIKNGNNPIFIINLDTFEFCLSEDELAGVLKHELAHLELEGSVNERASKKVEEVLADFSSIEPLHTLGYKADGLLDLLRRLGEDEIDLRSVDHTEAVIRIIAEPHPKTGIRTRLIENAVTAFERSRGVTISSSSKKIGKDILPTVAGLKTEYSNFNHYSLQIFLGEIGYWQLPTVDRISVLKMLVEDNCPARNTTEATRLDCVGYLVSDIEVDPSNDREKAAFHDLARTIMGNHDFSDLVFSLSRTNHIMDPLLVPLKEKWADYEDPSGLGPIGDLSRGIKGFMNPASFEDCLEQANKIMESLHIIDLYPGTGELPERFSDPSKDEVDITIARNGVFAPEYLMHVGWASQPEGEPIKKVLREMDLSDPWVIDQIGAKNIGFSRLRSGSISEEHKLIYLSVAKRTDDGKILRIPTEVIPEWPIDDDPNLEREEIERFHRNRLVQRKRLETELVEIVDWSMVETNFQEFVYTYGWHIAPSYSFVDPNIDGYPFATRFFDELIRIIPDSAQEYQRAVSRFLWTTQRDYFDGAQGFEEQIVTSFVGDWPYEDIERPKLFNFDHPLTRFALSPVGKEVISDVSRLTILVQTDGFLRTSKKFRDQFTVPLEQIITYPNSDTIDELLEKSKSQDYMTTGIVCEAERIAEEEIEFLSLEDLFVLEKLALTGSYPKFEGASLADNFSELRRQKIFELLTVCDDPFELSEMYRYLSATLMLLDLPDLKDEFETKIQRLTDPASSSERLRIFGLILRKSDIVLSPRYDFKVRGKNFGDKIPYKGSIDNPKFREWVTEGFSSCLADELGQDDGSSSFYEKAEAVVSDARTSLSGVTKYAVLDRLATKINAQKGLCQHLSEVNQDDQIEEILSSRMTAIAGELTIFGAARDDDFCELLVEFLSEPLSASSTTKVFEYAQNKFGYLLRLPAVAAKYQIGTFHQNFWSLPIEMRAVLLEKILFPIHSSKEDQITSVKKMVGDLFPRSPQTEENRRNIYAHDIAESYLLSVDTAEMRLLAAAILSAEIKETEDDEIRVGQKLANILSHLGPAGAKLMQAIHSHPQTPQDIKEDLKHSKTMHSPPQRWVILEQMEESGLLEQVDYVGPVIGSGSFGVTLENTTPDGQLVADTIIRRFSSSQSNRELALMYQAASRFVSAYSEMEPILNMVSEAQRSVVQETDMNLARHQIDVAQQVYGGINLEVECDNQRFHLQHIVAPILDTGQDYKRVELVKGEHFNDLPEGTEDEILLKRVTAKAVLVTQLASRFAGLPTDIDRHGGNVKVVRTDGMIHINHFDFGAMRTQPLTEEEMITTGKIFADAAYSVLTDPTRNVTEELISSMDSRRQNGNIGIYLNGLMRDLLALGDYINVLTGQDLAEVLRHCVTQGKTESPALDSFSKQMNSCDPKVYELVTLMAQQSDPSILFKERRQQTCTGSAKYASSPPAQRTPDADGISVTLETSNTSNRINKRETKDFVRSTKT